MNRLLSTAYAAEALRDERRHVEQCRDVHCCATFDCLTRHPEHDARMLVFGDRLRSCLTQGKQTIGTIGSHAGQQRRDDGHPSELRKREEQCVNRWPLMMQRRSIVERGRQRDAVSLHDEVMPAWRNVCRSRLELFAARGFDDVNRTRLVESIREGIGEAGRHVLRDDDRRCPGWQSTQQRFDRLRSAGRGTDGDDALPSA